MELKHFLVEIRIKDYVPTLSNGQRIVCFEEVLAEGHVSARFKAFDQFTGRTHKDPILMRRMKEWGITLEHCCAPEAIEITHS